MKYGIESFTKNSTISVAFVEKYKCLYNDFMT